MIKYKNVKNDKVTKPYLCLLFIVVGNIVLTRAMLIKHLIVVIDLP